MTRLILLMILATPLAACGGNGAKPSTSPSSPAESEANGGTTGGQTYGALPAAIESPSDPCVTP